MQTRNLTEEVAIATHLAASATRAAGSSVTPAVDATLFNRLVSYLDIGVLVGAATVLHKWQHCAASASSDSGWADVQGTSAISSAWASTSNGKLSQLELRAAQHSAINRYVRVLVSVATSSWTGACIVVGSPPMYTPATSLDDADVIETIVY